MLKGANEGGPAGHQVQGLETGDLTLVALALPLSMRTLSVGQPPEARPSLCINRTKPVWVASSLQLNV
jgi:hypothetical protein